MIALTEQEKQALLAEYAAGKQVTLGRYAGQDITWRVLEERTRILNTRVDNPPKYYTNGGMGSVDKLFALSLGEVETYLPADEDRASGIWWWLRSPGSNLLSAASVYTDGSVYDTGINIDRRRRPSSHVDPPADMILPVHTAPSAENFQKVR